MRCAAFSTRPSRTLSVASLAEPTTNVNILVTGVSGLVGSNLAVACRERGWTVVGTSKSTPVSVDGCRVDRLALEDPVTVAGFMADVKADVVIHSAASVNLSALETSAELVRASVMASRAVLEAAERRGCVFVLVSSDWVFPGDLDSGACYHETATRAPVNSYGKTKAAAEKSVEESSIPYLITRPANVYGLNLSVPKDREAIEQHIWTRSSLALRLLNDLRYGREVLGSDALYQSPTSAWSYARRTCELIEAGARGVVNVAGPQAMSRLAYLREFAIAFGMAAELVRRSNVGDMLTSQGESPTLRVPQNTSLCDGRLRECVGPTLSTTEGFGVLRAQLGEALRRHGLK